MLYPLNGSIQYSGISTPKWSRRPILGGGIVPSLMPFVDRIMHSSPWTHSPSSRWKLKPPVQGHLCPHRDTGALADFFASAKHLCGSHNQMSLPLAMTACPVRGLGSSRVEQWEAQVLWVQRPAFHLVHSESTARSRAKLFPHPCDSFIVFIF